MEVVEASDDHNRGTSGGAVAVNWHSEDSLRVSDCHSSCPLPASRKRQPLQPRTNSFPLVHSSGWGNSSDIDAPFTLQCPALRSRSSAALVLRGRSVSDPGPPQDIWADSRAHIALLLPPSLWQRSRSVGSRRCSRSTSRVCEDMDRGGRHGQSVWESFIQLDETPSPMDYVNRQVLIDQHDEEDERCSRLLDRIGPPLPFLPPDLRGEELESLRSSYQAFRAGHAVGARGDICWLSFGTFHAGGPETEELPGCKSHEVQRSRPEDGLCGSDAAYFSEPERYSTPGLDSELCKRRASLEALPKELLADAEERPTRQVHRQEVGHTAPSAHLQESATSAAPQHAQRTAAAADRGLGNLQGQVHPTARLSFMAWLRDEMRSRPEEANLPEKPQSQLLEVLKVPCRIEKLLGFGFLLCLDILLHELTYTPAQVLRAFPRLVRVAFRGGGGYLDDLLSTTERCDVLRFALLLANVWLISACFDVSAVYHYIRGESFLKLYVIFNMLEMFERWVRSIGVDLFELTMSSVLRPFRELVPTVLATLLYCLVHSLMHLLRVVLLNVAINTSSSAVFLIIVTNNFGEIKSTVFKKYETKSLFPIITSDIVERFYLVLDICFVLARLSISPYREMYSASNVASCLFLLLSMELSTDWIKFCLILKFSEMKADTLEIYKEVLIADILLCRAGGWPTQWARADSAKPGLPAPKLPELSLRGVQSFSHGSARRVGFSGLPLSTLVLLHLWMLTRSPCGAYASHPQLRAVTLLLSALVLGFLAKVLLSAVLLGCAARRRKTISKGLELFNKIKAL